MGREFMTQIEAVEKVGGFLPSATKQFCTASWLGRPFWYIWYQLPTRV